MYKKYDENFKEKIIKLYLENDIPVDFISNEYNIS